MLKAFHGDSKIKKLYLDRVKAHIKADEVLKGKYWENGKGCAVGCTIHSQHHRRYEVELGIPEWLARVEDILFERMSNKKAKFFPKKFLEAIKPGVDLEKVKGPFLIEILKFALNSFDHDKYPMVKQSIDKIIELYSFGGTLKQFSLAAKAARSANATPYSTAANVALYAANAALYAARSALYAANATIASDYVAIAADYATTYVITSGNPTTEVYNNLAEKLLKIMKGIK